MTRMVLRTVSVSPVVVTIHCGPASSDGQKGSLVDKCVSWSCFQFGSVSSLVVFVGNSGSEARRTTPKLFGSHEMPAAGTREPCPQSFLPSRTTVNMPRRLFCRLTFAVHCASSLQSVRGLASSFSPGIKSRSIHSAAAKENVFARDLPWSRARIVSRYWRRLASLAGKRHSCSTRKTQKRRAAPTPITIGFQTAESAVRSVTSASSQAREP